MSFLSGAMSYIKLSTEKQILAEDLTLALAKYKFKDIDDENNSSVKSIGWKVPYSADSGQSLRNTPNVYEFQNDSVALLQFVLATKKIPGSILREFIKLEETDWKLRNNTEKRPPKEVRVQIRESVTNELLSRVLSTKKEVDVVFNLKAKEVYIFASSESLIDEVTDLIQRSVQEIGIPKFETTFDLLKLENLQIPGMSYEPQSYLEKLAVLKWLVPEFLYLGLARETALDTTEASQKIMEKFEAVFNSITIMTPVIFMDVDSETKSKTTTSSLEADELRAITKTQKLPMQAKFVYTLPEDMEITGAISGDFNFSQVKILGWPKLECDDSIIGDCWRKLSIIETAKKQALLEYSKIREKLTFNVQQIL